MTKKAMITILAVLAILTFGAMAYAWGPGGGGGMWNDRGVRNLDKNDPRYQHYEATAPEREALAKKFDELRAAITANDVDKELVEKIHDDIFNLRQEMAKKSYEFMKQYRAENPEANPWGRALDEDDCGPGMRGWRPPMGPGADNTSYRPMPRRGF